MGSILLNYTKKKSKAASLAVFRFFFGIMMFFGLVRFWSKGWIETSYIQPKFHFSYYGFDWIQSLGPYTYVLFFICGLSSLFVAIGYRYRISIIIFFVSFTYIELIDKTTYLNHYYFITVMSFVMIFLPANATFSVDAYSKKIEYDCIPRWTVDIVKALMGIVYFYAGLAKLNSEWLLRAQPLKTWLPSKYDLPLVGETWMQQEWFHFAMSWGGALYDLCIPFLLIYRKTRMLAFVLVLFFHLSTGIIFPAIGMFPYVMIVSSLIFFDAHLHEKIINFFKRLAFLNGLFSSVKTIKNWDYSSIKRKLSFTIVSIVLLLQLLIPWRYLLYPGELFWTEQGYLFSWRVMLVEKTGYAMFKIVDEKSKTFFYVNNSDFLTSFQEKQMSFQPDSILEYAHYLGDHFTSQGHQNVQVFVDCHVALNGRMSARLIDPNTDLYKQQRSFKHKTWILPFESDIKIKGI